MKTPARHQWMFVVFVGLALLALQGSSSFVQAVGDPRGQRLGEGPSLILRARYEAGGSDRKVLPPVNYLRSAVLTSTINVTYIGAWPVQAQSAFEYAVQIWENALTSPVPIVVEASWEDLNYISPYVLGGASAANYIRDFAGAPLDNIWYPVALANKWYGSDLDPGAADIEASFNSSFLGWYFETDGNPGYNQYDFASVVLHEIGHGLGFSGSMIVDGDRAGWGGALFSTPVPPPNYPFIFDRFVVNGGGQVITDETLFENPSASLVTHAVSDDLYFSGSQAAAANDGAPPKLYAPTEWAQGSSFSHLDESTYLHESGNALMTPSLSNGEVNHFPGAIALGIFEDLGWGDTVSLPPTSIPTATASPTSTADPTIMMTPNLPATVTTTPVPAFNYFGYIPSVLKSRPGGLP